MMGGGEDFQDDIEDGPDLVEEDDVDIDLSKQSRGRNHFPNYLGRTGLTESELVHASATLRRRKLDEEINKQGKSIHHDEQRLEAHIHEERNREYQRELREEQW
jgi:hypothetical protein